ncbi:adenosylmethionine--8-amino-7-oxononanoate transaminase [Dermacoccus abyssi]|uniref:adenosylmethionine--8-amino-7-oxononanoate transaminase n=1 Tax=Dermacoccus abyssi TaxID=322596 RepID=UPI002AD2099D|nr:adenosylmethionine--8-amino-7-oxononanoate transaminase [Dermacoccus abyssi]
MPTPDVARLLASDRDHLWHPYSSATNPATTRFVESAHGPRLTLRDDDGASREVLDAMSSWWCAIHGYNVPELNAAAEAQLQRMSHVMFGGLTHEPAVRLGEKLVEIAPAPEADRPKLTRAFLADSGSVSVEVALKMALQVFAADERPRRTVLTIRGGYHGDTLHPMSVCDPDGGMHSLWRGTLPQQLFAPLPPAGLEADPDELEAWKRETASLYREHADEIAAVIVEPLLQGAGGMRIYDPECVRFLTTLAREHGALVIFDEIATGFGRTGTYWAADRIGITPDILCLGKALTGGYLTMAAVLCSDDLARTISERTGAMMHGPTFMGNPLSCAVALASIDLLDTERLTRAAEFADTLDTHLAPLRELPHVADVRTLGAVGVVELTHDVDVDAATAAALDAGAWIRPFRRLIYTMPPFVCTDDDLGTICEAVTAAVHACAPASEQAP